jgi:phospholipid/cholesterol/gamma-HCH transport system substrate-binding protein
MPSARGVIWARFRVTVVAIAAAAIVSVLVYLLTGGTLLTQKATLYLYIPDATGLDSSSFVRVNGISVGKVERVELSGSAGLTRVVRVVMKIEHDWLADIPSDSTAQIATEGSVGNQYVAITQGTAVARIQPNGEITYKPAPELLKALDIRQFSQQLREADATLTDIEQGRTLLGQFVTGTEMYDSLRRSLEQLDRDFRKATDVTGQLGRFLRTDDVYRKISGPLVELDDRLARIQSGQDNLGRALREDGEYVHFREQAGSLRKTIADLRRQPLLTSDETYVSWSRGLSSFIRSVDQFEAIPEMRNSLTYDNLTGSLRELRGTMKEFRENPKKFLRMKLF